MEADFPDGQLAVGSRLSRGIVADLSLSTESAVIWSLGLTDGTVSWLPGLELVLGMAGSSEYEVRARLLELIEPLVSAARARDVEQDLELEQRFETSCGATRWVRFRARSVRTGGTYNLLGIAADATSRHEDKKAMADLTDRYRLLVELSPDAIIVHEAKRLVYVNSAAIRFLGATSAVELLGKEITEIADQASIPGILKRLESLVAPGSMTQPAEAVLKRLDGGTLSIETVSVRTTWEGRPAFQVIMRDMSAQRAAEATLRYQAALVSHVSDAIIATSVAGVVTSWNPAAEAVYGRSAAEAVGRRVDEVVGATLDPLAVLLAGGVIQATHRHVDGTALEIRVSAAEMNDGYVLVCADETARRRAEEHFKTVVASLDEGVVVVGPTGLIESANPAAQRIFGIRESDLVGIESTSLELYDECGKRIPPESYPAQEAQCTMTSRSRRVVRLRRPDGRNVWLSLTSRLLDFGDTAPASVVTSFTDITERRAIGERLEHEATHDPLTELANRTLVLSRLSTALRRPGRADVTTVLFIDLDKFKVINDSLGHSVGDKVLRIVGERLHRAVHREDLVGRLGGDEFVVVTNSIVDPAEIRALAQHLREYLTEPITVDGRQLHIDASIGIVIADSCDGRTAEDLLRDADVAMYQAKTLGRGRYEFFDVELRERMQRRLRLEQDLRDALPNEQLWTAYQPVVDLQTGRMVAVEALMRWNHPQHGAISPVEFIGLAEESDLINVIGTHMLRSTTRELAARRAEHDIDIHLKVNLSVRQLDDPQLVPVVQDALATTGLPANALCLEVTESALMRDHVAAAEILSSLRDVGIRLAIDDFGTGYSSLAQLQRLTLDTLKIDRSFITGIGTSRDAEAIVTSIIAMAHAVDLTVIAEGVETQDQLEILRDLGCDQAQGFYLGRPSPADDLFPKVASFRWHTP
ncbi:EAL domain-containing protein [Amycolatopsis sp. cg5]|uniref:sensor domain-containing protein n=1 Tax=Amycolatopsis sp. cg5 TaxID=3238802 RepID=UPI003523AEB6